MQVLSKMKVSARRAVLASVVLLAGVVFGPSLLAGDPGSLVTTDRSTSTTIPSVEAGNELSEPTDLIGSGIGTAAPPTISDDGGSGAPSSSTDSAAEPAVKGQIGDSATSSKQAAAPSSNANSGLDTTGWSSFDEMNIGDFSASDAIVSANGQPGSARFVCFTSHFNYDDPIVAPGQAGAAHLHMFFGNTLADNTSTFESLSKTGKGTCSGDELNRSAYWVPALIDQAGQARIAQYTLIYYKSGPMHGQTISPLPDGLRMIAGNARSATAAENDGRYNWYCGFPGNFPTHYGDGPLIPDCNPGDALTLSLVFPQCWDGVNLDSPNHRDHMAYPNGNQCPASHPVIIPEITYNIFWNNSDTNTAGWYLSSDKHGGLDVPGGTTTHGDWFGAWHPEIMRTFVNECNNQSHDCKGATISPSLRLLTSPETGISDGQDIYNGHRSPQMIPVSQI